MGFHSGCPWDTACVDIACVLFEDLIDFSFLKRYYMQCSVHCCWVSRSSVVIWWDTTSSTGMGAGENGNNQWEWEGSGLEKDIRAHLYSRWNNQSATTCPRSMQFLPFNSATHVTAHIRNCIINLTVGQTLTPLSIDETAAVFNQRAALVVSSVAPATWSTIKITD